ncbi:MAG: superoxide dismutase family protein [Deinococcus sp.]|nr:superoxide dismutase family protein [Deinococcus sp.]
MNRTRTFALLTLPLTALALSGLAAAGGGYVPASAPVVTASPVSTVAPSSMVATGSVAAPALSPITVPALPLRTASSTTQPQSGTVTTSAPALAVSGSTLSSAAAATLRDASGAVKGEVALTQLAGDELLVSVQATGLTPGQHGMHVHTVGQCSDKVADGKTTVFGAAEGHFDPAATGNHAAPDVPATQAHAGDLPMLEVGADGRGVAEFTTRKFSLQGESSIVGRSLIVHADTDDYQTDPAGNSGARVLCGVIQSL